MHMLSLFVYLISSVCSPTNGEYSIYEPTIPSYLEHRTPKVATPIFPGEDLIVRVSMSHIGGILLYSYDANDNQLIGMLDGGAKPTLEVTFRLSGRRVFQLASLCSCRQPRCLNQVLAFRFRIQSVLYLSCNDGKTEIMEIPSTNNNKENFPIIKFEKTASNQAKFWVANHPAIRNTFPNSAQMIGCILDVTYAGSPLSMTVGGKVRNGCARSCPLAGGSVCRRGACLETYGKDVICDCTSAKLAGPFCNESSPLKNLNYTLTVDVSAVKISWDQNNLQMFELLNKNYNFTVNAVQSEIVFPQWPLLKFSMTGSHNRLHVLVIEFQTKKVNITIFPEKISYSIDGVFKFTKEDPLHISVQSIKGQIDVSYQETASDVAWKAIRPTSGGMKLQRTIIDSKSEKIASILATTNTNKHYITIVFVFVVIILIIMCLIAILLLIQKYCRKLSNTRQSNPTNANNCQYTVPNHEDSDEENEVRQRETPAEENNSTNVPVVQENVPNIPASTSGRVRQRETPAEENNDTCPSATLELAYQNDNNQMNSMELESPNDTCPSATLELAYQNETCQLDSIGIP